MSHVIDASIGVPVFNSRMSTTVVDDELACFPGLTVGTFPLEPSKNTIDHFFARVLNVNEGQPKTAPQELMPNVTVPPMLWLDPLSSIDNARLKISFLKEINEMLAKAVSSLKSGETPEIKESTLIHYRKLMAAYNMLDFSNEKSESFDDFYDDSQSLRTATSESSYKEKRVVSLHAEPLEKPQSTRPNSTGSHGLTRLSSFSRELMHSQKQKLSFVGNMVSRQPLRSSVSEDDDKSSMKLRIYSMIKRRELYTLSSVSVGLTMRQDSRGSATLKVERQRDKLEYYQQLQQLSGVVRELSMLGGVELLFEFLTTSVFRFIVVDVCHLLVDHGLHAL